MKVVQVNKWSDSVLSSVISKLWNVILSKFEWCRLTYDYRIYLKIACISYLWEIQQFRRLSRKENQANWFFMGYDCNFLEQITFNIHLNSQLWTQYVFSESWSWKIICLFDNFENDCATKLKKFSKSWSVYQHKKLHWKVEWIFLFYPAYHFLSEIWPILLLLYSILRKNSRHGEVETSCRNPAEQNYPKSSWQNLFSLARTKKIGHILETSYKKNWY